MTWAAFGLFFFNDTATTEIYTLSLHDALPISHARLTWLSDAQATDELVRSRETLVRRRSEEHTSELQSQSNLVCRLLLEKNNATGLLIHSTDTFSHLLGHRMTARAVTITDKDG